MGPQVKTGTHSVRQGTPSVPVAAPLARGEPCHPSSCPSIPPSVHPLAIVTLHPPSHWSTVLNHQEPPPPPLSFSLHPITNSPPLPLHFPPTLLPFASHPPTTRSPFSLSPINHPYITPVAKLLNYHTFVMSLVRTRDTVLIASP